MKLTREQKGYLFSNHPELARRWVKEQGKPKKMSKTNPDSKSNEIQGPKKDKAVRLPGMKRDFGKLSPSQSARHTPAKATEAEAMGEGQGVDFLPGSRHRELGTPVNHKGLAGRDVRVAARKG